jgi:hypothetical protein
MHLVQPMPQSPSPMPSQLAANTIPMLVKCLSELTAVQSNHTGSVSEASRAIVRMHARVHHALSVLLESHPSLVPNLTAAGLVPSLVDLAAQHPYEERVVLELKSNVVVTHLCEQTHAPACILAKSRLTGTANERSNVPGEGSSGSMGGGGGGGPGRQRGSMQGMDALLRTSRHSQRQDQRRSRELAAANLADITGQSIRLCQLALDRENGNQDRAANWLFEHGEGFLAEHPEYAKVPDVGGDAAGGQGAGWDEPDMPLYMLRDCFSYSEDSQAGAFFACLIFSSSLYLLASVRVGAS